MGVDSVASVFELDAVLESSAWRVDRVEVDRVEREKEDPEVGSEEAV
jgi:hypothetical protein